MSKYITRNAMHGEVWLFKPETNLLIHELHTNLTDTKDEAQGCSHGCLFLGRNEEITEC